MSVQSSRGTSGMGVDWDSMTLGLDQWIYLISPKPITRKTGILAVCERF
jgi:hypothetical protein